MEAYPLENALTMGELVDENAIDEDEGTNALITELMPKDELITIDGIGVDLIWIEGDGVAVKEGAK